MSPLTITVFVACALLFVGSLLIRSEASNQNCNNIRELRDSIGAILTLADEQTPASLEADKFYRKAQENLKGVQC